MTFKIEIQKEGFAPGKMKIDCKEEETSKELGRIVKWVSDYLGIPIKIKSYLLRVVLILFILDKK